MDSLEINERTEQLYFKVATQINNALPLMHKTFIKEHSTAALCAKLMDFATTKREIENHFYPQCIKNIRKAICKT